MCGAIPWLLVLVETVPERCHRLLFLVGEVAEKSFAYKCRVTGRGGKEVVTAVFRYCRVCTAFVVLVTMTLDEAGTFESVDQTAYPASGEEALVRNFGDSEPPLIVVEQSEKDLVFGSAET